MVLVDGLEQNRRREPGETFVVKAPLPHIWESHEEFDHAAAFYNEGWGPKSEHAVSQTRHVFFVKPDLFVIADELEPKDDQPHTYEALFHLDAQEVKVDGFQVATQNAGPNLTLLAFGAEGVSIVRGQKEPVVQGWLPDSSAGYGGIKPIPTAVYRKRAQGKTVMLYALFPSATAAPCPVKDLQFADAALKVLFVDGTEKSLRFQTEPNKQGE